MSHCHTVTLSHLGMFQANMYSASVFMLNKVENKRARGKVVQLRRKVVRFRAKAVQLPQENKWDFY